MDLESELDSLTEWVPQELNFNLAPRAFIYSVCEPHSQRCAAEIKMPLRESPDDNFVFVVIFVLPICAQYTQ